jgi:hypothetical protein
METDVEGLIGAGRHERFGERTPDTRLGSLQLRIPKTGSEIHLSKPKRCSDKRGHPWVVQEEFRYQKRMLKPRVTPLSARFCTPVLAPFSNAR